MIAPDYELSDDEMNKNYNRPLVVEQHSNRPRTSDKIEIDSEEHKKIKEKLRVLTTEYIVCDNKLREIAKTVKDIKAIKTGKEEEILKIMQAYDEKSIPISTHNTTLHRTISKSTSSITKDIIKDTLTELFRGQKDCDGIVKKCLDAMDEQRSIKEREYLKRTFAKKQKK